MAKVPALPRLLDRKLYKAGQTRGADDDVIYQNRVLRRSTVLIPYDCWNDCQNPPEGAAEYENGYIVLLTPEDYFSRPERAQELAAQGLVAGANALIVYETREQWLANNPDALNWVPAEQRKSPLGGQYIARVPANTAEGGDKINRGFTTTKKKGAGIRVFEYASKPTINQTKLQLEAVFWLCIDADATVIRYGMSQQNAELRKASTLEKARLQNLLDLPRLKEARILNQNGTTICPLCLEEFSAEGFFKRMPQAQGRAVQDLTVTQVNLFHIQELKVGVFNHRPYNVGWGHHHCNVVARDVGIPGTLKWMETVLTRNGLVVNRLVAAAE